MEAPRAPLQQQLGIYASSGGDEAVDKATRHRAGTGRKAPQTGGGRGGVYYGRGRKPGAYFFFDNPKVMPSGAVPKGRGSPLQPKGVGLPGITRKRVGFPLKILD